MQDLIACLLNMAEGKKVAILGYVWGGDPPVLLRFSNVTENTPQQLHRLLRELVDMECERRSKGQVRHVPVPTSFDA
jgi:hypothetical protein